MLNQSSKLDENIDFVMSIQNYIYQNPIWLVLKVLIIISVSQMIKIIFFRIPDDI